MSGEATLDGSIAGISVGITFKEIECSGCTIQNASGAATGSGRLIFKKATVETPSTFAVRSVGAATGTVETKALSIKADYMEASAGTASWMLSGPTSGTVDTELN